MKNYFVKLFNYDGFESNQILDAIIKANMPEKPVQLMAHLLAAQQVWVNRLLGTPRTDIELWPSLGKKQENLRQLIADNSTVWIHYLNSLADADFENVINYKNMKGEMFEHRLSDIITHVINHGTHHRAQIGQILKAEGLENLPGTDYIMYLRSLN